MVLPLRSRGISRERKLAITRTRTITAPRLAVPRQWLGALIQQRISARGSTATAEDMGCLIRTADQSRYPT
jgi:hypothetical protein